MCLYVTFLFDDQCLCVRSASKQIEKLSAKCLFAMNVIGFRVENKILDFFSSTEWSCCLIILCVCLFSGCDRSLVHQKLLIFNQMSDCERVVSTRQQSISMMWRILLLAMNLNTFEIASTTSRNQDMRATEWLLLTGCLLKRNWPKSNQFFNLYSSETAVERRRAPARTARWNSCLCVISFIFMLCVWLCCYTSWAF